MIMSLIQIKSRIRSVESIKKITRAMEMVSISKLRRVERLLLPAKAYHARIEELLMDILPPGNFEHPWSSPQIQNGKALLCVIASDTGFCSTYNHSLLELADKFLVSHQAQEVILVAVGKKALTHFKRKGREVPHAFVGLQGRYSEEASSEIIKTLSGLFASGKVAEVYALYMKSESATRQMPWVEKILGLKGVPGRREKYILEPELKGIIDKLIPEYLASKMRVILLNAFTCEHRARSIAMGGATQSSSDLLEELVISRNKVRQTNITRELVEVVSSAQALTESLY